ncbi:hypothetical protein D9757_007605 [Collybiopsis confluens]|uniref:Cytochrome P450 n=1 Tax=Collybiopsis confluens TaxID=2823264 RepID=A0A8H5H9T4_9AGAR|nr:hypothetical protein D9757_007605 [Collybiopsis confluens]
MGMPALAPWFQYQKWGNDFGELVYLQDRNILILNHSRVAIDLLEKRARIYSDRRVTPVMDLTRLIKHTKLKAIPQRYSSDWRFHRKLFRQSFRQAAVPYFFPAQYHKTHELLNSLITDPNNFMQHVMALSQRVIYESLYSLDIPADHPLAKKSIIANAAAGASLVNGTFPLFERFPFLRFMPAWLPGCGFKQQAIECSAILKEVNSIPFNIAVDNLKSGLRTSLIAELVMKSEGNLAQIEAIQSMGLVSFIAAADTTVSSIGSFFLCMCLYQKTQRKGQEELDRVVGRDRLPTFEDRNSLPYVEAIYREVMRLHPAVPLGNSLKTTNQRKA